jgi:hypothetical protein
MLEYTMIPCGAIVSVKTLPFGVTLPLDGITVLFVGALLTS